VSQRITGAAIVIAVAAALALTGYTGGPAPQDMPGYGSAVVPCAQIRAQVTEILHHYQLHPGPDDNGTLYGLETALAARFGNVSNADEPLALSKAEVDFNVAVTTAPRLDAGHPSTAEVSTAVDELAAACGIAG